VWREEDTPEALKGAYQRERDPEVRTWLHGLWLLRCGWSLGMVAEAMGTHYRSVQRWVAWYREGGLSEVMGHKMGGRGRPPLLRPEEEIQVSDAVARGRLRRAWEIRDWIAQQYGASYTLGGVYSLLRRLKCAPKVPHPGHAKTNRQVQAAWKKERGMPPARGQNNGGSGAPERVEGGAGAGLLPHAVMRHDEGGVTSQLEGTTTFSFSSLIGSRWRRTK
jgi:transposase